MRTTLTLCRRKFKMHRPRLASYIFLLRLCTSTREFARCNPKRELSATRKALEERDGKEELGTVSLNIKTYLRAILLLAVTITSRDTGALQIAFLIIERSQSERFRIEYHVS